MWLSLRYTITWCILLWLSVIICPFSYYYYSPSRRNESDTKAQNLPCRSFRNFSMLLQKPRRSADRTLTLTFTMTLKWQASKVKKFTLVISTFLFWKARYIHENFAQCAKYHDTSFVFYTLIKNVNFSWRPSWKNVFKIAYFLTRADINSVPVPNPPFLGSRNSDVFSDLSYLWRLRRYKQNGRNPHILILKFAIISKA